VTTARAVRAALAALVLTFGLLAVSIVSASAQSTGTAATTTTIDLSSCVNSEPLPTCGRPPQQSGDPGGSGQLILLGLVLAATAIISFVVARSTIRVTRSRSRHAGLTRPRP
jgi:hypothetical protein